MRLVFNERGLADLAAGGALPCVAQQFLNHGGRLFKVFTLGAAHNCLVRSSICDLYPSTQSHAQAQARSATAPALSAATATASACACVRPHEQQRDASQREPESDFCAGGLCAPIAPDSV